MTINSNRFENILRITRHISRLYCILLFSSICIFARNGAKLYGSIELVHKMRRTFQVQLVSGRILTRRNAVRASHTR